MTHWLIASGDPEDAIEVDLPIVRRDLPVDALVVEATREQVRAWCETNCGVAFDATNLDAAIARYEAGEADDML